MGNRKKKKHFLEFYTFSSARQGRITEIETVTRRREWTADGQNGDREDSAKGAKNVSWGAFNGGPSFVEFSAKNRRTVRIVVNRRVLSRDEFVRSPRDKRGR